MIITDYFTGSFAFTAFTILAIVGIVLFFVGLFSVISGYSAEEIIISVVVLFFGVAAVITGITGFSSISDTSRDTLISDLAIQGYTSPDIDIHSDSMYAIHDGQLGKFIFAPLGGNQYKIVDLTK